MGLLSIIARLGLDSSSFDASLQKSQSQAEAFGAKMQRSILGSVGKFFTLGFGIDSVLNKINEIEHAFDRFDDTARETAEEVPMLFAPMMEELNSQQRRLNALSKVEEKKKDIQKLEEDFAKLIRQNALKEMSDEERKIELIKQRAALMKRLVDEKKLSPAQAFEILSDIERTRHEITTIKSQPATARLARVGLDRESNDPLARIGGFTGGAEVRVLTVLERTANATEQTAENTQNNIGFA